MKKIPKLALIPSGYGDGKLYSVMPTNGSGDFDVTRGSSATRINKDGLIEIVGDNVPRLDYPLIDGVVSGCPSLLLEPQRTNLIVNSQALSLTPIKNGTFTDDFAISPDGTQNASKFTAPDSDPYFYQSVSFAAASYTVSVYIKGIGSSIGKDFRIVLGSNTTDPKLIIPSEWTRFEYTVTTTAGSANAGLEIADPAVTGDEVLVWGWQLEEGSYPTSYIPTQGSTVTRLADVCNNGGNEQVINSTEGVLYADIANALSSGGDGYISLSSGSSLNRVTIRFTSATNNLACQYVIGGANQTSMDNVLTDRTEFNKIAFKFKENDFAVWVNGVELSTDLIGSTLASGILNKLSFDNGSSAANFYGNIKDLRVYNTALTDSELQKLTAI